LAGVSRVTARCEGHSTCTMMHNPTSVTSNSLYNSGSDIIRAPLTAW
jgi:hypothetical protein